jgi:hypothetical protein
LRLDTLGILQSDFGRLRDLLNLGGFTELRDFRARNGDLVVSGKNTVRNYRLAADAGQITVDGTGFIDAGGKTGGSIALIARTDLILEAGSILSVEAREFSNAGKGGDIYLEAGASTGGTTGSGSVSILDLSEIRLGVAAYRQGATSGSLFPNGDFTDPTSSAFRGQFRGILHIRAPRLGGNDVAVNTIRGTISGASSILVEGYKIYDRTAASGVMNRALRDQINSHSGTYITAFEAANSSKLLGGTVNAGLDSLLVMAPGVEVINTTGDLELGKANPTGSTNLEQTWRADWDLSSFRYGAKNAPGVLTMRAAGDIIFNNTLSDGFSNSSGGVSATSGHSALWLAELQNIDSRRPANLQSWSYRITAGADLDAASGSAVVSGATTGSVFVGEIYDPVPNSNEGVTVGDGGLTSNTIKISETDSDRGTRYEVVRTGTGSIDINAAVDVQLRNQFATIYTAGVRIPSPENLFGTNDFQTPLIPALSPPGNGDLGARQQYYGPFIASSLSYGAQYSMAGGSILISAGQDIKHVTDLGFGVVDDSSRQTPTNWLYRRGYVDSSGKFAAISIGSYVDPSASTTWWIDYSNFFEGVGALGGGDVSLIAGKDVRNVDAFAPTNARMSGRDALGNIAPDQNKLLELGGGDVRIVAGSDINGGIYYVERGMGELKAGGVITTNYTRTPSRGILADPNFPNDFTPTGSSEGRNQFSWLPTTLFLGKGAFDVSAAGDILMGPVVNAFMAPQGLNNQFWYKTYFSTYSADSEVRLFSKSGSITLRQTVKLDSDDGIYNPLELWYSKENRNVSGSDENSSYYQPWIRLAETEAAPFATALSLLPPRLFSTAFNEEINLQGNLTLAPSASGTLELVAANNINGLAQLGVSSAGENTYFSATVNVSDSDPSAIFSISSPSSFYGQIYRQDLTDGKKLEALRATGSAAELFGDLELALTESGSYLAEEAGIGRKLARHASGILHAEDSDPVRIYSGFGDISGFTLYTPKFTQIVADNSITDISFYIQNTSEGSISLVSAGKDIIPFFENSKLRNLAQEPGNVLINALRNRSDGTASSAMAGDIQINGPGILEVLAGRDLDLGSSEKFPDGTGAGITGIGRLRNPFLPFEGARLILFAGIQAAGGGPAVGLSGSSLTLDTFISDFIDSGSPTGLLELHQATLAGLETFDSLGPEQQAITALDVFFALLRKSANEQATTGSYAAGFAAVDALFGQAGQAAGEIFTRTRDIRTTSGGAITIGAPGGGMTMASSLTTTTLTPPGVVTEYGGPVDIFLNNSLDIGATRIFTLRGGDLTIWSTAGDIAAGSAAKTVVTAPPTRVSYDATSGEVLTDLGGLATGGGIGVLASVEGVKAGSVFLIAPSGIIDAGDAGIRATGDITLAAAGVLNADNVAAGGTSVGVPSAAPVAAPNVGGLTSGSSSSAATSSAANSVSNQANQQTQEIVEAPSTITVEILGYGGGESDEG